MSPARRRTVRFTLLLGLGLLCPQAPSQDHHARRAPALSGSQLTGIRPEGRLRKLHLVRPDLIPYPLSLEVYC